MATKWNSVILLSFSQALFQTASILVMTLSGMLGLELSTDKSLATLPIAMISVGTAIAMIPASLVIRRMGERNGFMIGTLFGIIAGLLAYYAVVHRSFSLFVVANMLVGCHQGFAQYYRFAAADSVPQASKGKAISFVMAGGVVAAITGPNLAKYTKPMGIVPFAYSYLSITIISLLALMIIFSLKLQKPLSSKGVQQSQSGRPLREILSNRQTIAALVSSAVGYSVMTMIMTATPIAMYHCGHSSNDSATVIQWHVLGMFVPSFFTGTLIQKFSVNKIILTGVFILMLHVTLALNGTDFMHFISGLILLGIGWNFMFIGGTTLLTTVYLPEEKEKTQAFHDFLVFTVMSVSSFWAGGLLNHWGWQGVNLAVLPMLGIAMITFVVNISRKVKIRSMK